MKFMNQIYKLIPIFLLLLFPWLSSMGQNSDNGKRIITNSEKVITIYPIPAKTVAYVRISPALQSDIEKIEIVNLIGKKVAEQTVIDKNISEYIFNNLNEYPKGIYIIITRDKYGKIVQSAKMIIDN